jgi:hypothetical protein
MERFISEFGLNMCANGSVLLQDEHLGDLERILGPNAPTFHIYIIGSRPRIAVVPEAFVFLPDHFKAVFRVQTQDQHDDYAYEGPYPKRGRFNRIESEWPHTTFRLLNGETQVLIGKSALLAAMVPELRDRLDLEVLYVGQSFGESGEREAPGRLQSHSTLQKILGEASRRAPDREVWLALFHFEEMLLASFDGRLAKQPGALEADEGRIERVLASEVSEQQRINFTEAALIRFFDPRYNKVFRTSFPDPSHKTYRECYDLDLNMVSVELDTEDLHLRVYSAVQPRRWRHFIMFPLNDPTERKYMLDLLQPDPPGAAGSSVAVVQMMDIHKYENDHVVVILKDDKGQLLRQRRIRKAREAAGHPWVGTQENERAEKFTERVFDTQKDALDWAKELACFD